MGAGLRTPRGTGLRRCSAALTPRRSTPWRQGLDALVRRRAIGGTSVACGSISRWSSRIALRGPRGLGNSTTRGLTRIQASAAPGVTGRSRPPAQLRCRCRARLCARWRPGSPRSSTLRRPGPDMRDLVGVVHDGLGVAALDTGPVAVLHDPRFRVGEVGLRLVLRTGHNGCGVADGGHGIGILLGVPGCPGAGPGTETPTGNQGPPRRPGSGRPRLPRTCARSPGTSAPRGCNQRSVARPSAGGHTAGNRASRCRTPESDRGPRSRRPTRRRIEPDSSPAATHPVTAAATLSDRGRTPGTSFSPAPTARSSAPPTPPDPPRTNHPHQNRIVAHEWTGPREHRVRLLP